MGRLYPQFSRMTRALSRCVNSNSPDSATSQHPGTLLPKRYADVEAPTGFLDHDRPFQDVADSRLLEDELRVTDYFHRTTNISSGAGGSSALARFRTGIELRKSAAAKRSSTPPRPLPIPSPRRVRDARALRASRAEFRNLVRPAAPPASTPLIATAPRTLQPSLNAESAHRITRAPPQESERSACKKEREQ
jgi:hypothetical protein